MAGEWLALFRSLSEGGACSDSSDGSLKRCSVEGGSHAGRAMGTIEAIGAKVVVENRKASDPNVAVERGNEAASWSAEDWRAFFEERCAHREFDGGYDREAAERLAWGELQNRWHLSHGERVSRDFCAGCRRPIGNGPVIALIDGNRVHDRAGHTCFIQHGARWRGAATRALLEMGLKPPKLGG
jgi:hypothetical protein